MHFDILTASATAGTLRAVLKAVGMKLSVDQDRQVA